MTRPLLLTAALALLAGLWWGPLPAMTATSFSAHMLLHMALVAVVAPLAALALVDGHFDPARRWPRAFNPVAASVFELLVVWGWHAPAFHTAARADAGIFALEQVSFLVAGLWLWIAACGGSRSGHDRRAWAGMTTLLFTSIHMTLLGALFALAPRAMYAHHGAEGLADLHLGGSLMLLVGGASYLAGGLWLARQGLASSVYRGSAA